jgi:ABC-type Fe3+ transport system substrate-binding protein
LAIPPHPNWLVQLSLVWGEEKVKDFTRKLVALSGGQLRGNETERIVSGEFPIMAYNSLAEVWQWQAKGAPLAAVPGSEPILTSYFQLGVPRNSAHPNLARLFVGFMTSKEAQAILEKYEFRSSHLVEGTIMAKYVRANQVRLQDVNQSIDFYLRGGGLDFLQELARMLKR